jgi:hypothetical protein
MGAELAIPRPTKNDLSKLKMLILASQKHMNFGDGDLKARDEPGVRSVYAGGLRRPCRAAKFGWLRKNVFFNTRLAQPN